MLVEVNIDALVGPSHHFGGLGVGNIASLEHRFRPANPRAAALEGVEKANLVAKLGLPQFVLPPLVRPDERIFSQLGFEGSSRQQFAQAAQIDTQALSSAFSSAFMWAANSATVTPAVDSTDGCYHFTPANLISSRHRATECFDRARQFRELFSIPKFHTVHDPLPAIVPLRDEGAANHMRLSDFNLEIGFNVFVYGERGSARSSHRFAARQSLAACHAIARRHRLKSTTTFFLQQHPDAIDAGVFHNDVIATSHKDLLIHHERAYIDSDAELQRLETAFEQHTGHLLIRRVVSDSELSLSDAVKSYVFNSQIVSPVTSNPNESVMICPSQCQSITNARCLIESFVSDPNIPIAETKFVALDQSMSGGGGPACLRLRIPADSRTLSQMPARLRLNEHLADKLRDVIQRCYPISISLNDFTSQDCLDQIAFAYKELCAVLGVCAEDSSGHSNFGSRG